MLRWLLLLEVADLLLDVFVGFVALYLVDEAGASHGVAGLAVAVWAGAGLAGSAAMIPLLRRVDGLRYLRLSAVAAALLFVAFLLVPGTGAKLALLAALGLVNAGWYPVLQARLYDALGGASSLVLTVEHARAALRRAADRRRRDRGALGPRGRTVAAACGAGRAAPARAPARDRSHSAARPTLRPQAAPPP